MTYGTPWTDGNTAQTAIGQLDNHFTPIQLATYCATIANGGVRKQAHFLDKVYDYTGQELLQDFQAPVVADAGISSDVMGVVWEAMRQVCTQGTAREPELYLLRAFGRSPDSGGGDAGIWQRRPLRQKRGKRHSGSVFWLLHLG